MYSLKVIIVEIFITGSIKTKKRLIWQTVNNHLIQDEPVTCKWLNLIVLLLLLNYHIFSQINVMFFNTTTNTVINVTFDSIWLLLSYMPNFKVLQDVDARQHKAQRDLQVFTHWSCELINKAYKMFSMVCQGITVFRNYTCLTNICVVVHGFIK